jgi:hypothetical protein
MEPIGMNSNANGRNGHVRMTSAWQRAKPDSLPLQNLETEMSCIGAMLWDNSVIDKVMAVIKPEDFWRDTHQIVARRIFHLWSEHGAVDAAILGEDLEALGVFEEVGGNGFLEEVTGIVPHAANAEYYAEIIRKLSGLRSVDEVMLEVHDRIRTQRDVPKDIAHKLLKTIEQSIGDGEDEAIDVKITRPQPMADEAFYGVLGQIVRKMAPHSEADAPAIMAQLIGAFASMAGYGPHWKINATRHNLNLYFAIVGQSSRARKGTSWDLVEELAGEIDPYWKANCVAHGGMSSGEGFLEQIRDARYDRVRVSAKSLEYQEVMVDCGVEDKRILWIEEEFGGVLTAKGREGNILDKNIKNMWGKGQDSSRSRNKPLTVTNGHVTIIGHITMRELLSKLSAVDTFGGLANRFIWIYAERPRLLPRGGDFRTKDFATEIKYLRDALDWSRRFDWSLPFRMEEDAWHLFDEEGLYRHLGRPRAGVMDDLTARAEPQVRRLACVFALSDGDPVVSRRHLEAAHAFWDYSERSVAAIFDCAPEHHDDAKILDALRAAPDGLNRTEIARKVFRGNIPADELTAALSRLLESSLIRQDPEAKKHGRRAVIFYTR